MGSQRCTIENKIAGRTPGSTLYLVQARSRDGELRETVDDQQYKLFIAHPLALVLFMLVFVYWARPYLCFGMFCGKKLVKVAHTPLAIPSTEYQITHGSAKWTKADKVAAMKPSSSQASPISSRTCGVLLYHSQKRFLHIQPNW